LLADRGQSVAGLIIEPLLQGAGGMRLYRPSFLKRLLETARAMGVLVIFEEEKTLQRIARINKRHKTMLAELAARPDVTRPRLIGSILAFEVKSAGGYQSAESRALRDWYLAHGLNIR